MLRSCVALVMLAVSACAVAPFDTPVATAVARDPMRRRQTDRLDLYYPQTHDAAAERLARQLRHACVSLSNTSSIRKRRTRSRSSCNAASSTTPTSAFR